MVYHLSAAADIYSDNGYFNLGDEFSSVEEAKTAFDSWYDAQGAAIILYSADIKDDEGRVVSSCGPLQDWDDRQVWSLTHIHTGEEWVAYVESSDPDSLFIWDPRFHRVSEKRMYPHPVEERHVRSLDYYRVTN